MRGIKSLQPSRKLNFSPWEYHSLGLQTLTHQRTIGNSLLLSLILGSALVRLMRLDGTLCTVMAPVKGTAEWALWQALAFGGDQMTLGQKNLCNFGFIDLTLILSRNLTERCPGDQTNNRAELLSESFFVSEYIQPLTILQAILRVLETAPISTKPLMIKTDSQYSIDCWYY